MPDFQHVKSMKEDSYAWPMNKGQMDMPKTALKYDGKGRSDVDTKMAVKQELHPWKTVKPYSGSSTADGGY